MLSKVIRNFWNLLKEFSRLNEQLSRFYAWRIFEVVPRFKKIIYKLYDRFWYLELKFGYSEQNISKILQNNLEIDIVRLNFFVDYFNYSKNGNLNQKIDWERMRNFEKI
ncbi:MAG: hypothetical protein ACFFD7_10265, partial [Candidatus Thorarchaeota archaeon]